MKTVTVLSRMVAVGMLTGVLAWAAEAPKEAPKADTYPLDTCVVSGEKLGGMGAVAKHDYKGREIRFCCKGCTKTFEKDPAKYLKKIDDAAKAKADTARAKVDAPKDAPAEKAPAKPVAGHGDQPAK